MITTVDLPAPGPLWRRWATLAAALTALGREDSWTVGPAGAHHDDGGGSWSHLALVEGDRAVLWGYDRDYSATTDLDPPLDLLAGAPAWLPWEELARLAAQDQLGYVLWYDGTAAWQRVSYPDDVEDGLDSTAGPVLGERAAHRELEEFVFVRGGHGVDTPAERAAVAEAADRLLAGFGPEALHDLVGRLTGVSADLPAALAVAARAGLLPGTAVPVLPPGRRPAGRLIRKLSEAEHDRLIWTAMREETERTRPVPVPTGELGALVTWLRGRAPAGDGRCSLLVYADDAGLTAQPGEHPPADLPGEGRFDAFRELSELVRRLRAAEADDTCGSWLFLRVETTAGTVSVDRRYDAWPSWWADDGISGPWRGNLRREVGARAAAWHPSWTTLLNPEVAYRPA
ncbi:hypothetical protein AB0368_13815 [Actinoplanes sp. NPDC051475]|uniref:hypothetical protein n=1 Tax=Actinoplanes sp. NPDC051475 TaxID=3157225 RepID=UPI00344D106A